MPAYASPHITLEQWQAGQSTDIDVFEDQLRTWLFEQARTISPNQHSGPAILALVSPYFEAMACYRQGQSSRGSETTFLLSGLEAVFPAVDAAAREEYVKEVRHGFAHEAVFRKVLLHRSTDGLPSFGLVNGLLVLDPWWVLDGAETHFNTYVGKLRNNEPQVIGGFNAFMSIRKAR